MRFIDTNVLLYAVSKSPTERLKTQAALEVLSQPDLALSVQVLQEFYVQATRPRPSGALTHLQAMGLVESFQRYPVQETTIPLMTAALHCRERYHISYWDAAIIEAARLSGCRVVLSEDLSAEQDYAGVRVHNPFQGM